LPPDLADYAVWRYQRGGIGLLGIAAQLRCNPLGVLVALEQAGVPLRGIRTWNHKRSKWLFHKAPRPEVAAELAAWRRYRAYVEVMNDRHRRKYGHRKPWLPDHKACHLAALWLKARAKRPRRKPRPFDQRTRDYFRRYDRKRRAIAAPTLQALESNTV
jgi:hypothetical protein